MDKRKLIALLGVGIISSLTFSNGLNKGLERGLKEQEGVIEKHKKENNKLQKNTDKLKQDKEKLKKDKEKLEKENKQLEKDKKDLIAKRNKKQQTKQATRSKTIAHTSGKGKRFLGTFTATAYTDNASDQEQWVGKTASGMKPQVGVIAVDRRVIPLGTKLYVEGYGDCIAGDVGGAIKGNRLDLFFNTSSECNNWGRKPVKVWVK